MQDVRLIEVQEEEIGLLHEMQKASFMPLYEKYRDEDSPAKESPEKVKKRAVCATGKYYFIVASGVKVGAINLAYNPKLHDTSVLYVSRLFVLPAYQNRGMGYAAIQHAFALHPEVRTWRLDTILQEPGNCRLYEKCGFVRTGTQTVINEKMTLIDYEKSV